MLIIWYFSIAVQNFQTTNRTQGTMKILFSLFLCNFQQYLFLEDISVGPWKIAISSGSIILLVLVWSYMRSITFSRLQWFHGTKRMIMGLMGTFYSWWNVSLHYLNFDLLLRNYIFHSQDESMHWTDKCQPVVGKYISLQNRDRLLILNYTKYSTRTIFNTRILHRITFIVH